MPKQFPFHFSLSQISAILSPWLQSKAAYLGGLSSAEDSCLWLFRIGGEVNCIAVKELELSDHIMGMS